MLEITIRPYIILMMMMMMMMMIIIIIIIIIFTCILISQPQTTRITLFENNFPHTKNV